MTLAPHMVIHRDPRMDIGRRTGRHRIPFGDHLPQRIGARREIDVVALAVHRAEDVIERGEDREIRRAPRVPRVRREVEEDDRDLALAARGAAEGHQLGYAVGEYRDPPSDGLRGSDRPRRFPPEDHRTCRAIELGDRHLERRLQGIEATGILLPLPNRLKLEGLQREIGHVERAQHRLCRLGVVVCRSADEGEPRQRDQRIDRRLGVPTELGLLIQEVGLDRRAGIEARREGRYHREAARFERIDHRVIVRGIAREEIRPPEQEPDRPGPSLGREVRTLLRDPPSAE